MPILCLEGPSAVGKTAAAARLAADGSAYVVPEVDILFERPSNETAEWYLEPAGGKMGTRRGGRP